jgi:hypothetical protein
MHAGKFSPLHGDDIRLGILQLRDQPGAQRFLHRHRV